MSMRLCLIGHPVAHSLSPRLHNAAFSYYGLAGSYELLDVESAALATVISGLAKEGFSGANITVPHKEAVYKLITDRSAEAELVGAVNCLRLGSDGSIFAHNTDLGGFINALKKNISGKRTKAALIGSGGAARACLWGLSLCGFSQVDLIARNSLTASYLAEEFRQKSQQNNKLAQNISLNIIHTDAAQGGWDAIINCTPIGLHDEIIPIWFLQLLDSASSQSFFFDSVYSKNYDLSLLAQRAQAAGLNAIDGRHMLVEQALLAFEFWTGKHPPDKVMYEALSKL